MGDHITNHALDGDILRDKVHVGQHAMCRFCGATNAACALQVKGKKVSSKWPHEYDCRYASALGKGGNVPRHCLMHLYTATPLILGVKEHMKLLPRG